ncbi:hypothetical protein C7M84_005279 [Penaeus vannamei]|uniref:Uncharacterized protein n=1 Tax=Penaeus vannamei TaxID=6689 RepID=A0A423TI63_PENVA|nr:hypothetical protein C7M84_005279 [Penaeus vannamei]
MIQSSDSFQTNSSSSSVYTYQYQEKSHNAPYSLLSHPAICLSVLISFLTSFSPSQHTIQSYQLFPNQFIFLLRLHDQYHAPNNLACTASPPSPISLFPSAHNLGPPRSPTIPPTPNASPLPLAPAIVGPPPPPPSRPTLSSIEAHPLPSLHQAGVANTQADSAAIKQGSRQGRGDSDKHTSFAITADRRYRRGSRDKPRDNTAVTRSFLRVELHTGGESPVLIGRAGRTCRPTLGDSDVLLKGAVSAGRLNLIIYSTPIHAYSLLVPPLLSLSLLSSSSPPSLLSPPLSLHPVPLNHDAFSFIATPPRKPSHAMPKPRLTRRHSRARRRFCVTRRLATSLLLVNIKYRSGKRVPGSGSGLAIPSPPPLSPSFFTPPPLLFLLSSPRPHPFPSSIFFTLSPPPFFTPFTSSSPFPSPSSIFCTPSLLPFFTPSPSSSSLPSPSLHLLHSPPSPFFTPSPSPPPLPARYRRYVASLRQAEARTAENLTAPSEE